MKNDPQFNQFRMIWAPKPLQDNSCSELLSLNPHRMAPNRMHTLIQNFLSLCNHEKQNFWHNLNFNFLPLPLLEGGTLKKIFF